jgi:hypothetical protein
VVVYYRDSGKKLADDLVLHLQETFGDRLRRAIAVEGSRTDLNEGEMRYGGTGFATVAGLVARAASERLAMRLRRPVALRPGLGSRTAPGVVMLFVPSPASAPPTGADTDVRRPGDVPDIVGQPEALARDALTRAGYAVLRKYVERNIRAQPPQEPGTVIRQELIRRPNDQKDSSVLIDVVATATVMVAYARKDEQRAAGDLAEALRRSIGDPQYIVRSGASRSAEAARGEVRYSAPGLEPLARRVASEASSWIARTSGRRVAMRPVEFDKVSSTYVVLYLPELEPR